MSGAELAREVLTRRPHLPVLFVSGYVGDQDALSGVDPAGERFLEKPFTPSQLTAKVREVIQRSRIEARI